MPKTEANTRPDNRDVKQARLKYRQALDLFERRLANLNKTDMLSYKKNKQSEALRKEFLKTVKPFNRILSEGEEKAMVRKVQQTMSDMGYSSGRSTNSDNLKKPVAKPNSADTPGKGSDEPITRRNKNKGGLIKTGAKDYRKGGMFY
jgi:hypothetical protein